jgi:hypothetical protein
MEVDETSLGSLLEESQDTHADAMRSAKVDLNEFVEIGLENRAQGGVDLDEAADFTQRRNSIVSGRLAAVGATAGIGAAVLALSAGSAGAATMATDIQILQTAQSIEILAVATYKVALTLPFIGGATANGVVKAFSKMTMAQHTQHGEAFGSAIKALGGKQQTAADPVLLKVVDKAKPGLKNAGDVVALALELEDGAAQTYVANTSALRNTNARKVTASIMGVEAQHAAILRAVQALIGANDAKYIALPPSPLSGLPSAAGSVGFPNPFYPTSAARPETEGAR